MDDLAVADTRTTVHYLTLDLPCNNKQQAIHRLPTQIPNEEIITSMQTALLYHPGLPLQARKSHIFLGLNKSLLSIGTLCDHGCEATSNDNSVRIKNKHSGNNIMRGTQYTRTNLYMLNLTQQKKIMTESTTPGEYFAGSAYKRKSKIALVDYHHASCWGPTQIGWGKAITKKLLHFLARPIIGPGAQTLNGEKSTILGHLQQPRKGHRSTQEKVMYPEPDPEQYQFPPSNQSEDTNILSFKTVDLLVVFYTDQTGRFPVTSSKYNKYILVAYHYDSNTIHVEPLKTRSGLDLTTAYQKLHILFTNRGLIPHLYILYNECPNVLKISWGR